MQGFTLIKRALCSGIQTVPQGATAAVSMPAEHARLLPAGLLSSRHRARL